MTDLSKLSDEQLSKLYSGISEREGAPVRITVRPPGVQAPLAQMSDDELQSAWQQTGSDWADVAKSAGAGVVKGVSGLVGLPHMIGEVGASGFNRAVNAARGAFGSAPNPPPADPGFSLPSAAGTQAFIERNVTGPLPKPQTTVGEYAQTIGEFAPGSLLGPGRMLGNLFKFGAAPAVASEAAGQAVQGSAAEPYVRAGTALATGGAAAVMARPGTASQAMRAQMPEGVTPQMVQQAEGLIAEASQMGLTLSWPEALSHVAGRPVMTNMLRHLEASPQTEARMAEFFGQRPQEVEAAGRRALNTVAPATATPSSIGPAVGREMEGAVTGVKDAINAASRPHYTAAEQVRLTPQEFAQVQALPGYAEAVRAVRNDPQLARYVQGMPEDSVGFLNQVKIYFDQMAENAAVPVSGQANRQRSAGYSLDATAVRDAATRASPDYVHALEIQRQGREALDRILDGPIGKIANRDQTTRQAIDVLFPRNPLPNSAQEIRGAVGALANRSPRLAGDLVRAHAESVFNAATRNLQSGPNQAGGAKFAMELVGNPQARENLRAAVEVLPNGAQRWAGFERVLEVLEATGTRQGIGSRTAYNADLLKQQAASGLAGEAAKGSTNPVGRGAQFLADRYERYRLGRNLNELAAVLTDPRAGRMLQGIAAMPVNSPQLPNAVSRALTLANPAINNPRQP